MTNLSVAGNTICTVSKTALEVLKKAAEAAIKGAKVVAQKAIPVINAAKDKLVTVSKKSLEALKVGASKAMQGAKALGEKAKEGIQTLGEKALPVINRAKDTIVSTTKHVANTVKVKIQQTPEVLHNAIDRTKEFGQKVMGGIKTKLSRGKNYIATTTKEKLKDIKVKAGVIKGEIKDKVEEVKTTAPIKFKEIKENVATRIHTGLQHLSTVKNRITTVAREKLPTIKEKFAQGLNHLKERVKVGIQNISEKIEKSMEEYNAYLEAMEAERQRVQEMKEESITQVLDQYNSQDSIRATTPLNYDVYNDRYREIHGKDNDNFIKEQPKTIERLNQNRDVLVNNNMVTNNYYDLLNMIQLKVEIIKSNYSTEEKMMLCGEINNCMNQMMQLTQGEQMAM